LAQPGAIGDERGDGPDCAPGTGRESTDRNAHDDETDRISSYFNLYIWEKSCSLRS
jgi:hypothetical protein